MRGIFRSAWPIVPLWGLAVAAAVLSRPILPIDETRYVAVAWEMWSRGDYLVPHLNGAVYSHKPPLLFWLINAGWAVFGVHEWVARLVGPAFALLDFFAVGLLARALWPEDKQTPVRAGAALLAFPVFTVCGALLMFDAMLTFFVLVALIGIIDAARGKWRSSALVAIGVGGGILTKGPVVFVYLVPAVLAAPWWSTEVRMAWRPFAGRIAAGLLAGIVIALAWAVPAAIYGGAEYREAILWKQTAGRVSQSFAHRRPFWFYLALVPGVLFPWIYWRPAYGALGRSAPRDEGLRFCTVCFLGGFVLISLISGKQVHYLLPMLPAAALVAARASARSGLVATRATVAGGVYALAGVTSLVAAFAMPDTSNPRLHASAIAIAAVLAVIASCAWVIARRRSASSIFWWSAATCAVFVSGLQWMAGPDLRTHYDPTPLALELKKLQDAHVPIVHRSEYHGQYHFAGRLTEPLTAVESEPALLEWCAAHPDGYVIKYWKQGTDPYPGQSIFTGNFRGKTAGLVRASAFLKETATPE